MMPGEDIRDAIARGDRQAVKAWLNAEDSDLNSRSVDGPTLLGKCVMAAAESRSLVEARRRAEEKALVEKARRLRDSQRREEEAARRSADEVAALEEERRAAEEDRIEAQEERRSAEKFSDGLDGLDGSDASVSVSDSVEIEHPPRAEDAEDEKRASPASSTRAKPLETESAAVRAFDAWDWR